MPKEMDNILDDMEHRVRKIIADHRGEAGFPDLESYGVTEKQFDDYLFDKQAIIDDDESLKKNLQILCQWNIRYSDPEARSVLPDRTPSKPAVK